MAVKETKEEVEVVNNTERQYLMWLVDEAQKGNDGAKLALLRKAIPDHIRNNKSSKTLSRFIHKNPHLEEQAYEIYKEESKKYIEKSMRV